VTYAETPVRVGDRVQVNLPSSWAHGLEGWVDELRSWGAVVMIRRSDGLAPIRLEWAQMRVRAS
jgi:hypothetical protein